MLLRLHVTISAARERTHRHTVPMQQQVRAVWPAFYLNNQLPGDQTLVSIPLTHSLQSASICSVCGVLHSFHASPEQLVTLRVVDFSCEFLREPLPALVAISSRF